MKKKKNQQRNLKLCCICFRFNFGSCCIQSLCMLQLLWTLRVGVPMVMMHIVAVRYYLCFIGCSCFWFMLYIVIYVIVADFDGGGVDGHNYSMLYQLVYLLCCVDSSFIGAVHSCLLYHADSGEGYFVALLLMVLLLLVVMVVVFHVSNLLLYILTANRENSALLRAAFSAFINLVKINLRNSGP